MNNKRAWWVMWILVLVLAGCGGADEDIEIEPTATPAPTLSPEERVTFDSGTDQNPLRLVMRPADTIAARLNEILATEFDVRRSRLSPDADLRDTLEMDDVTALNPALRRDFGVELTPDATRSLETLADLNAAVQAQVAGQVADAVLRRTGLHFEIVFVEAYADALVELCQSGGGLVSLPLLDGVTYTAAVARNCGQPALHMAAGVSPDGLFVDLDDSPPPAAQIAAEAEAEESGDDVAEESGDTTPPEVAATPAFDLSDVPLRFGAPGVIVANADLGTTDVSLVSGRTFCRLGYDDYYSWLLPSLVLQTRGIDLATAAAEIRDYANSGALLRAVASGDCAAAGFAREVYDTLTVPEGVTVIAETVDMPYGVLMVPLEVGLGVRLALAEHLPALAVDAQDGRALHLLLGQTALVPVESDDLEELDAFMQSTGLNFAQLGD